VRVLHAYCLRRAGEPAPGSELSGVDGAPVRLLEAAGLGVWISAAQDDRATVQRLREHDRVVREALRTATPLPLRYGTLLRSEPAAAEMLAERAGEFRATLDRLTGTVEMGVRIDWDAEPEAPDADPGPPGSQATGAGRAYLEARRAELANELRIRERAESLLLEAEAEFADLGLPTVRTVLAREGVAGSLAHLVHRSQATRYRERAREVTHRRPDLRITLTGPWAPYSFV
jgi:hypothetical protein